MLSKRLLTAALGLPILIGIIIVGGPLFNAVAALTFTLAAAEFYRAASLDRRGTIVGAAATAAVVLAAATDGGWLPGALVAAVMASLLWPVLTSRTSTALADASVVIFGIVYIGWLGAHAVLLRDLTDGRDWVLLGLFAVFATDTAAYAVGRILGRHTMTPNISPRKTWEGGVGGFLGGFGAVLALNSLFGLGAGPWAIVGLALILPVVAELGDLAESALKRSMAVKDMGTLLPGHGGVIDRMDSLLFALPVLYYWVRWVV